MIAVRHSMVCALLGLVTGCATSIRPGALSPIGARVTNEAIAADALTLDGWTRRVSQLQQSPANASPQRAYVVAHAAAWLVFAREAYGADPRDSLPDRALDETRRLVESLELGALPLTRKASSTGAREPRGDLWAALDSLRGGSAFSSAPALFADAEVSLTRAAMLSAAAGRVTTVGMMSRSEADRQCTIERQLTRAALDVSALRGSPVRLAAGRAPELLLAGGALPITPVVKSALVPIATAPKAFVVDSVGAIRLIVHFEVGSAKLTPESRIAIDQVINGLANRPTVGLALEGYADHPGAWGRNPRLESRRIAVVRGFLSARQVDLRRLVVARVGHASAGTRPSVRGARRMPITLEFIGSDGRSLTVAGTPTNRAAAPRRRNRAKVVK